MAYNDYKRSSVEFRNVVETGFVTYLRVSTDKQGAKGLGIEAQRTACNAYLAGRPLLAEFVEVESGADNHRPQLAAALNHARLTGATLVIAKLDRLSRNAAFLLTLQDSAVRFVCADMPEANALTVGIMALMAQHERSMISARTKAALSAKRAQGHVFAGRPGKITDAATLDKLAAARDTAASARRKAADGFAADLAPTVLPLRQNGCSLAQIAATLASRGIRTPRGGAWTPAAVANLLGRLGA